MVLRQRLEENYYKQK